MDLPHPPAPSAGVEAALRILGGKWKVLILWHLIDTPRRYGALRRLIPEITEKMLIRQLRELEQDGIIGRRVYPSIPPRVEYSVTNYGRSLYPILDALCQWGWSHLRSAEAEMAAGRQETCGDAERAQTACEER